METQKIKKYLKETYSESLEYIKESKKFIYIIIGVFFGFALIGFLLPAPEPVQEWVKQVIQEILEKTANMGDVELTAYIFLNNTQSSFLGLSLGIMLGIFPIAIAILNGYILGFVSILSVQKLGILSLWRLIPHGIFELTAVFISFGLGLKLGTLPFKAGEKEFWKMLKNNLIKSLKVFVFIIIPLLFIAAIIEGVLIAFSRV